MNQLSKQKTGIEKSKTQIPYACESKTCNFQFVKFKKLEFVELVNSDFLNQGGERKVICEITHIEQPYSGEYEEKIYDIESTWNSSDCIICLGMNMRYIRN